MGDAMPHLESWQAELASSVRDLDGLARMVPGLDVEALRPVLAKMRLSITPHSASLVDWQDPADPLRKMALPAAAELSVASEERRDPIGDDARSPLPFLTHRYPDRVLVHATYACSQYCRFCFRREKTGVATAGPGPADMARVVEYLAAHPEVEEAIVTGGDPLVLTDEALDALLGALRGVPSLRRLRIHTRVLVNLPSRVTPGLVATLRKHQSPGRPVYVVTHFNHPRELAPANVAALAALADAGIVVRNQSVLLAGVNDNAMTLDALLRGLADHRVVPYYLHQLDLAPGTSHFRVPIRRGIALMRELQGRLTGIALPRYMLDVPGGKGKVPLSHQYLATQPDGTYAVECITGETTHYAEPAHGTLQPQQSAP
jgi:lysine 2,3-aminomutase